MKEQDKPVEAKFYSERQTEACRIETQGGTVYWLSEADDDGTRWVVREHLQSSDTNTMVMQKFSQTREALDLGDKFRAKLAGDIQSGMPFILDVPEHATRILSEPVVTIEVGNVPQMIFR